ncbi:SUKH-3 domain-containing protein [Mucilaginibacter psychrotolerans]|uniref:SUKH-3 domain containing protein n=1 Tax=Mucilaginibacter psychrotolerans TaxID=1524096 RepID=A0A4Y8S4Q0_9SPHI|nr:SUKH-3 domain-containing protein [Mucilaginibacter psychrotolerans]TFF33918.1 hypothetical protein E2R66_23865 [Mucilaginibacter psychrotolerans]
MFRFSDKTYKVLVDAGWHPQRNYDIGSFKECILNNGYRMSPIIEQFLMSYGGLKIEYNRKNGTKNSFHFDARTAIERVDDLWAQTTYYERLKVGLCVVGQADTDHLTLMMDETGKFYGGFDDFLCFIAESGEEAIEAMCSDREFEEIT